MKFEREHGNRKDMKRQLKFLDYIMRKKSLDNLILKAQIEGEKN